jgi:hypothetical protein
MKRVAFSALISPPCKGGAVGGWRSAGSMPALEPVRTAGLASLAPTPSPSLLGRGINWGVP